MRSLKSLVIGMGVLIAIGSGLLVYGLVQKVTGPGFSFFSNSKAPARPAATSSGVAPFGDVTVRLPAGCQVEGMRPDGERLFLRIGPTAACSRIVVVDIVSGKVLGNVNFWNTP